MLPRSGSCSSPCRAAERGGGSAGGTGVSAGSSASSTPAAPAAAPPGEAAPPPGAAAAPPAPAAPAAGEAAAPPPAPALATPAQLQQLVSPIALYPDSLVAQILAGSTYPTQVVEAERFVQQNPNLTGDALAAQVNPQPWDPSVRSLCQFPSVLQMMSQNVSWTSALGQAYYTQPQDVLAAIQVMRRRAMRAGTLKSTSQQKIVVEAAPSGASGPVVMQEGGGPPQIIVIQPAQPNVVYVPAYNPTSVYGAPIAPPPGYSPGYSGGQMLAAGVIGFGAGFLTSSLINHGNNYWGTNWSHGNVVYNRNVYISNTNYFAPGSPGYRPGYPGYPANRPGYPGYPANRPGYPGYPANRPGYPNYPANRPGYPGYGGNPANRPGYPAGYPPRPVPYTGKTNLAATNPNLKPIPKPGTYPNRSATGKQPYPGRKPVGNVPGGSVGTTKPGGY